MLQSFYGVIQVEHYQTGRLRLQTDVLKENVELEQEFLNNMKQLSGINEVKVNLMKKCLRILFCI